MRVDGFDTKISEQILRERGLLEKPTGLAAFGSRNYAPVIERPKTIEEDKPEVIEDEGGHAADCGIYDGEDCTCNK
jgi:hypothetical protein